MKKTIITGLIAVGVSATASANPLLNYTYIEGGLSRQTFDQKPKDLNVNTQYLTASLRNNDVVLQASYDTGDRDENIAGIEDTDIKSYGLFVGGVRDINDNMNLLIGVGFTETSIDTNTNDDFKTYSLSGELRYLAAPQLELNGTLAVLHSDYTDKAVDNDTNATLSLGVRYHISELISVGLEYTRVLNDSDIDFANGNVRFQL